MSRSQLIREYLVKLDNKADGLLTSGRFLLGLVLVSAFGFWIVQVLALELYVASTGSSPLHWIYLSLDEGKSLIDWPTGTRNLGKSLPMHAYRLSSQYLNADLFLVMKIYMGLEILAMLGAYYFFARHTTADKNVALAVFFTLIVSLTAFQSMNLARFGYPFVWGLYYSFASAARILGFALIFKNRPWPAMVAFALSVMTHPLMGFIGILGGLAIVGSRGLQEVRRYLIPALVTGSISAAWLWISLEDNTVTAGNIPHSQWIEFTRTFNYHWYPFYTGVFESLSFRYWLPFLSLILLYVFVRSDEKLSNKTSSELNLLVVVLSIITATGLFISYFEISPFLIKLSLHRASDLLVVITFVVVLKRIYADATSDNRIVRALSVILLVSPVLEWRLPGLPVFISLLYTATFIPRLVVTLDHARRILLALLWITVLIFFINYLFGLAEGIAISEIYLSRLSKQVAEPIWWIILSCVFVLLLSKHKKLSILLILAYISFSIVTTNQDRVSRRAGEKSRMWYDTQEWARDNTPENALFMLDPTLYGGWRGVSRRASFGTAREWLHNAWLYDSDYRLFKEGIRRFGLLDLKFEDYYSIETRIHRLKAIDSSVRVKFYNAPPSWYQEIAEQEGVDYFVFERKYLSHVLPESKIVYQNKYYLVTVAVTNPTGS